MTDATLARIEDHLRRIADALERPRTDRLPELVDIAQRGLDRVAYSFRPAGSPDGSRLAMQDLAMELRDALDAKPCDDRTCTDRDHWAPLGRIDHGSTPTTCVHGQDHPDSLECVYRCAATMPGHRCTRREHADDRHVWAMSDEEAERILRSGRELGFVVPADPLDESDHRPRHDRDGGHVYRHGPEHWHDYGLEDGRCDMEPAGDDPVRLSDFPGPLTFCDCEPEPDPLDESDHRPRHDRDGDHWNRWPDGWWGQTGGWFTLAWLDAAHGPLTFCDCAATIEAENGATD